MMRKNDFTTINKLESRFFVGDCMNSLQNPICFSNFKANPNHALLVNTIATSNRSWLLSKLQAPMDIAPLVYARIVLCVLMSLELSGGLFTAYSQTLITGNYHFSYQLFPFVKPWSNPTLMHAHFVVNFILGVLVALGFFYRYTVWLFFLTGTSLFLMEKSLYINHIYLYCLCIFLFGFLPANRGWSWDVWRKPELAVSEVPAWTVYILIFQISLVYLFAGIAKINADWLQAQPIQIWLSERGNYPFIGSWLTQPWYAYLVAYGGLFFDLLVVPLMLWPKTRLFTFIVGIFFHVTNVATFGIGTFPWFSIAATALFFPPAVFRKWLDKKLLAPGTKTFTYQNQPKLVYGVIGVFVIIQLLAPLRPHLYSGNASWTEEGHFFAWRMMLRAKRGYIQFFVKDGPNGTPKVVPLDAHLNTRQITKMQGNPDMILQFAHYLEDYYRREEGYQQPEVNVKGRVKLNARKSQAIVDEQINLVQEKRGWHPYPWILRLEKE